jgi:hypothetical protein
MGWGLAPAYVPRDARASLARQTVARSGASFVAEMAAQQVELPASVKRAMDRFTGCGDLERGFVRVRCAACRLSGWSRFHAKSEDCVPRAAPSEWPSSPPTSWTACFQMCPAGVVGSVPTAAHRRIAFD